MDKEFASSLIENDTLIVCNQNQNDLRQFVNILSDQLTTSTTTTTQSSSQIDQLPMIYFVTPTYPRHVDFCASLNSTK